MRSAAAVKTTTEHLVWGMGCGGGRRERGQRSRRYSFWGLGYCYEPRIENFVEPELLKSRLTSAVLQNRQVPLLSLRRLSDGCIRNTYISGTQTPLSYCSLCAMILYIFYRNKRVLGKPAVYSYICSMCYVCAIWVAPACPFCTRSPWKSSRHMQLFVDSERNISMLFLCTRVTRSFQF